MMIDKFIVYALANCVPVAVALIGIHAHHESICDSCSLLKMKNRKLPLMERGFYKFGGCGYQYEGMKGCPLEDHDVPPKYCAMYKPREEGDERE